MQAFSTDNTRTRRCAGEVSDSYPCRLALLINFIPPYRVPLFKSLQARVSDLKIFVSTGMEPGRPWTPEWDGLNVRTQRNLTLHRTGYHPRKFAESLHIHIPYDTLGGLRQYRPDVLISGELGFRTLQAMLYRNMNPLSRIIIWGTLSEHTEQGRGKLRERLRNYLVPRADAIIVNGNSGERYIRRFGVDEKRIFRVPQAVVGAAFSSAGRQVRSKYADRLLYVGQLIERKGLEPFLMTLSGWANAHPTRTIEVCLVGDGPVRAKLQALTLSSNLQLHFVGNVPYAELPRLYARASVLVFPTLADEWGLVVNEAMAAGLPVLGSLYSQAVEDLILDNVTGWTFYPDQVPQMYKAINRALTTPREVMNQMRAACQRHIEHLTPDSAAEGIMQAIRYVCSPPRELAKTRC